MTGPTTGNRRVGVIAVVFVLSALLGLATWTGLGDPDEAPQRSPGTQGALRSKPPGPPSASPPAGSATASPTPTVRGSEGPGGTLARVAWGRLDHPLWCQGTAELVQDVLLGDVDGDETSEALVTVRCAAGAGSPPSALYVYDGRRRAVGLVGELLTPRDDVLLTGVAVKDETVIARGTTYSSSRVPRCCPDERFTGIWRWRDGEPERIR